MFVSNPKLKAMPCHLPEFRPSQNHLFSGRSRSIRALQKSEQGSRNFRRRTGLARLPSPGSVARPRGGVRRALPPIL